MFGLRDGGGGVGVVWKVWVGGCPNTPTPLTPVFWCMGADAFTANSSNARVLCTALVGGWVGGWVAVQHSPPPPPHRRGPTPSPPPAPAVGVGTILGPWVHPKSGWVGLVIRPPPSLPPLPPVDKRIPGLGRLNVISRPSSRANSVHPRHALAVPSSWEVLGHWHAPGGPNLHPFQRTVCKVAEVVEALGGREGCSHRVLRGCVPLIPGGEAVHPTARLWEE